MISLRPIDAGNYRGCIDQALGFYRRNGFAETGEIEEGEIVVERRI